MEQEFHGVIKLISGEEIFALISVDDNDGDPIIMLQSPVIMKMLSHGNGQYVKAVSYTHLTLPTIYSV